MLVVNLCISTCFDIDVLRVLVYHIRTYFVRLSYMLTGICNVWRLVYFCRTVLCVFLDTIALDQMLRWVETKLKIAYPARSCNRKTLIPLISPEVRVLDSLSTRGLAWNGLSGLVGRGRGGLARAIVARKRGVREISARITRFSRPSSPEVRVLDS